MAAAELGVLERPLGAVKVVAQPGFEWPGVEPLVRSDLDEFGVSGHQLTADKSATAGRRPFGGSQRGA